MAVKTSSSWEVETGEAEAEGHSGYITEFDASLDLPETLSYNIV